MDKTIKRVFLLSTANRQFSIPKVTLRSKSFIQRATRRLQLSSAAILLSLAQLTVVSHVQATDAEPTPPATPENFTQCISSLQERALAAGVQQSTVTEVLGSSEFVSKVIVYDRRQPEFVQTFSNYFGKRVNDWRINRGRELYQKHQALLKELTAKYGVPAHYLVSFWGLETNFGNYKGKMPIIDSLVTLACDPRRSEFFSKELVLALQLMDREGIGEDTMVGSWAGAMGHTQFMPSAYMKYAIDGDNDGKADLWNSIPDALTSAANFLQNLGWTTGFRWGREVALPTNFNYQLTGRDQPQPLSFWTAQGLTKVDGSSLGKSDIEAALLVPAGHQGPAFLVYKNFDVIMKWNRSEFYATAVGHLADRIAGAGKLSKPLPDLPTYTRANIATLQEKLNELGFDVGKPDGIMGPATRKGIRDFQASQNMIADGFPNNQVWQALQLGIDLVGK